MENMFKHKYFQYRKDFSRSKDVVFFVRLYVVTFLIMVPLYSIISHAIHYQPVNVIKTENDKRLAQAKAYLADMKPRFDTKGTLSGPYGKHGTLNNPNVDGFKNSHSYSLAISVITVSRGLGLTESDKPHYILQSVAAFLNVIQQSDIDDIHLHFSICNVDIHPKRHIDMQYIPKWVTVFQRNAILRKPYKSVVEKETDDYIFCLQKGLEQNTSYLLLVEDDALPHPEFLTVMKEEFLMKDKHAVKQRNLQDVAYIKLHTNDKDVNFIRTYRRSNYLNSMAIDIRTLFELIALAMVFAGLGLLIHKKYTSTRMSTFYTFLLLFIYTAGVIYFIGRQNVKIVWRYILGITHELSSAPAGSTVAMLFPRDGAEESVRYLSSVERARNFPKDVALNDLSRKYRKQVLYIEPALFTHIGRVTALPGKND